MNNKKAILERGKFLETKWIKSMKVWRPKKKIEIDWPTVHEMKNV